jgi:Peptidase propeptide and YPEB domain
MSMRSAMIAVVLSWCLSSGFAHADDVVRAPETAAQQSIRTFLRSHQRVVVDRAPVGAPGAGLARSVYGRTFGNGPDARATCETFLSDYAAMFGVRRADLRFLDAQSIMRGKFTLLRYEQRWINEQAGLDVPVDGARIALLVREEPGRPLVWAHASTRTVSPTLTPVRISRQQAERTAREDGNTASRSDWDVDRPDLVVTLDGDEPTLAWKFWVQSPRGDSFERWEYLIDANTGQVLSKRDGIVHIDITGQVNAMGTPGVLPDQPDNPPMQLPLFGARVATDATNATFVREDGSFTLPFAGAAPTFITVNLDGEWCRVENRSPDTFNLGVQEPVTPGTPVDILLNEDSAALRTSQVNAMIHATRIHNFVKGIIPGFTGIDLQIPTFVNISDDCNAFYTPGFPTINFFTRASGPAPQCPNTAFSTVVYHEYGHFVIDRAQGFAAPDYHEGIADTISQFLVNNPCVGDGFFGMDQGCLRNIDEPDFVFPVGAPQPHINGLAIAGAFWDMRTELMDSLGEEEGLSLARDLLFNQILTGPAFIDPIVTTTVLTLDDDDADIFNGTPNYLAIHSAFSRHGMPGPELALLNFSFTEGVPQFASPLSGARFPIEIATGPAGTPLDPSTALIHIIRDDGTTDTSPLTQVSTTADGVLYEAHLPATDCYDIIRWFVSAEIEAGDQVTRPEDAPENSFRSTVATEVSVVFSDSFDSDNGWTTETVAAEDPFAPGVDLTVGGWERVDPTPVLNPEDDDAVTQPGSGVELGAFAFITGAETGDPTEPGVGDVDWGPVRLTSPLLSASTGEASLAYWRWFYNDDGDDSLVVEVSNDGGDTWAVVETVTGKTGWVRVLLTVSDIASPSDTMLFRFSTQDLPNNSITEAGLDAFEFANLFCATADFDGNGAVDLHDFGAFQRCFTGTGDGGVPGGCEVFDFDQNDAIDLIDFGQIAGVLSNNQ